MKGKLWTSLAIAAAMSLMVSLPTAVGQGTDDKEKVQEEFSGTYGVENGKDAARKKINRSIDRIVEEMAFYKRPWADDKLEAKTVPCATLEVSFPGDDIAVECDDRPVYKSPVGNEKTTYTASDGSKYALRQNLDGRTLTQTFVSEDGTRTNKMTLTPSGKTILMRVRLESGQLPRPLEYSLTYEKK
ncbi:hypothetical protein FIV42_06005 [Persicimonas caeni]|uniref:Lipocalin-like domain-containing protein n=1 Tax=Persicimonas caeni TaxID=2292766 RepID=A0A4Y6PPL8_PERCE|nr:hypothetical protein [Persicimonas caeni]QDG50301.1 hypothetical protein FIV42_06005 [Persicimonas caeni]QED31522.1 hypothetical protein FRD00_06000 [Persicimonas caeni]